MKKVFFAALLFSFFTFHFSLHAQDTLFLNLEQCCQRALECSQDLQRSNNVKQQAELTRKSMFTNFFPQVEGSATVMYIKDQQLLDGQMGSLDMLMRGAYMCGFTLQQPLFAGGKIVNGHRLTKVGVEVSKEQQRQQRAQTLADVESAYWTYVAVLSKERLLEEYCRNLDTLLSQVEVSVTAGMATDYDLLQVSSARRNLAYQRLRTEGGITLCRLSLSRLVGISSDDTILLPDPHIPTAQPTLLSSDFSSRPELRLLQLAVDAADLQVKMKRADFLPTLGIGIGYNWVGNIALKGGLTLSQLGAIPINPPVEIPIDKTFDIHTPMLAISLSVPITKWWQGSYEIRKAKLEAQNSRLEQEKNRDLLRLEVQQAIQNVTAAYALIEASQKSLAAAEEQLRVAQNRYNVNMLPLSDLLDAQAKRKQAESDCIEARTQYFIYLADYRRVTSTNE